MAGLRDHGDQRGTWSDLSWLLVEDGLWDRKTCVGATALLQAPARVAAVR